MENINFYYDPQRQGYDTTFWSTISGTPAIAANKLVMNAATAISHSDIYYGELNMNLTIPTAPTAGDVRRFGYAQLNMGAHVGFKIVDDKFYYEAVSPAGNETVEVTWSAGWTNTATTFKILWNNQNVKFYIADQFKGEINNTAKLPKCPLSIYVSNTNADVFKVNYLYVRDANVVLPTNQVDINVGDVEIGAVELKNAADDSRAIIDAANTARNDTDNVLVTQIVDAAGLVNTVSVNSSTVITGGSKTVAATGTAESLGATIPVKSVYIRAKVGNTQNVYIGDSNVDKTTSKQVILAAGEAIAFDISDRATVYVDVDVNGEGVDYLCLS